MRVWKALICAKENRERRMCIDSRRTFNSALRVLRKNTTSSSLTGGGQPIDDALLSLLKRYTFIAEIWGYDQEKETGHEHFEKETHERDFHKFQRFTDPLMRMLYKIKIPVGIAGVIISPQSNLVKHWQLEKIS